MSRNLLSRYKRQHMHEKFIKIDFVKQTPFENVVRLAQAEWRMGEQTRPPLFEIMPILRSHYLNLDCC